MSGFAGHLERAIDAAIWELEALVARVGRSPAELGLGFKHDEVFMRDGGMPWFVFDRSNGDEVVGRFRTVEAAERFAEVYVDRSGGTIDRKSFAELGADPR